MIVTTLMLFSWIAGVFSNKKIDEETPEENISSYNAPEIEMTIRDDTDNQTPEVRMPEPLSHPRIDAEVEIGNKKILDAIEQSLGYCRTK